MGFHSPGKTKESSSLPDRRDVPRNEKNQPKIRVMKPAPIKRDPGRMKEVEVPYTRMTTFIDALDDKSNLGNWKGRMLFKGMTELSQAKHDWYTREFAAALQRDDKRRMNGIVAEIQKLAGAEDASDKGTYLHKLSEHVDRGEAIPDGATEADLRDMLAYETATVDLDIQEIERFVVMDDYKVGGTPDRISRYAGLDPDGNPAGTLITDLKTGSTTYGGLKMAMQLAGYAHGRMYNMDLPADHPESRVNLPADINQNWGLIINVPAGSGVCTIYWIDLQLGWEAFQLAKQVRVMRNRGKYAFRPFGDTPEYSDEDGEDVEPADETGTS